VSEVWSVHASEDACDIAMRAPGAGRVAADEVMVAGPIADDIRRAIAKVDAHALVRDASEGWIEITLDGPEARDVVARLSELELPDGTAYVQGDVARVLVRAFVGEDGIALFVGAAQEAHLRRRIAEATTG
jgi:glycine cleavage system aminomethyltransferase T